MSEYEKFLQEKCGRSSRHFFREFFKWKGIKDPTLDDIKNIPEDFLQSSWISIVTMKEILILQQQMRK